VYRPITEFMTYWKSIFTNDTAFQIASDINPWLLTVYRQVKGCVDQRCEFNAFTSKEYERLFMPYKESQLR